jgi:hypothetical protein
MIAAVFTMRLRPQGVRRGRKVRTPQGSVPDNVRDGRLKAAGRQVQQRMNRLKLLICLANLHVLEVRVKRCGKSAPRGQ